MAELTHADRLLRCNLVDCRPPVEAEPAAPVPRLPQPIDYQAKDYDSFLRALLDLLPARVPGWQDRSEADLGMAVLELFAFVADQLSYLQDRIANEGFLRTATQYESIRRHLKLVDYEPHPGLAASADLTVAVSATTFLPAGFQVRSAPRPDGPQAGIEPVVFETAVDRVLHPELNSIALAADAPSGPAGDRAVLAGEFDEAFLPVGALLLFRSGDRREWARVAAPPSVDTVTHRTTVTLAAPLTGRYPAAAGTVAGNHVPATHGTSRVREATGTGSAGQTIELEFAPIAYTAEPDGTPRSSLVVVVGHEPWREVEDFIESGPADAHYRTTSDNNGFVTVEFGDGAQGRAPQSGQPIQVRYRTGLGEAGLVAADTLTDYDEPGGLVTAITNPFPSAGAREPETIAEAKLLGPRRIRTQDRAVTPEDFERLLRAGVRVGSAVVAPLHVKAHVEWTGSWTTLAVSVDLPDRRPLAAAPAVRAAFEATLRDKRVAGCDVRLEDARYAPLHIGLVVHVKPEFFARHVRRAVEEVLGAGGFFAPDRFGFGQSVYLSDLYAAVMAVGGVRALAVSRFKRLGDRYPDREADGFIPIDPLLIARCDNDPDHPEHGIAYVRTCGGKEG